MSESKRNVKSQKENEKVRKRVRRFETLWVNQKENERVSEVEKPKGVGENEREKERTWVRLNEKWHKPCKFYVRRNGWWPESCD